MPPPRGHFCRADFARSIASTRIKHHDDVCQRDDDNDGRAAINGHADDVLNDTSSYLPILGWHYLSNNACLMRPHLLYACLVVSRIIITCYIIRHF